MRFTLNQCGSSLTKGLLRASNLPQIPRGPKPSCRVTQMRCPLIVYVVLLLFPSIALGQPPVEKPVRLIFDTDMGNDVDDACSIGHDPCAREPRSVPAAGSNGDEGPSTGGSLCGSGQFVLPAAGNPNGVVRDGPTALTRGAITDSPARKMPGIYDTHIACRAARMRSRRPSCYVACWRPRPMGRW